MSNKSAPGPDRIPYFCPKHLPLEIIAQLTNLLNAIVRHGHFPTPWKASIVIPIPKRNLDNTDPANYRPIYLLPTISKVFKHIKKNT